MYDSFTTANLPAETDGASLSGEQRATTPSTRMNAFTQSVSYGNGGLNRHELWARSAILTPASDFATEPVTTLDAQQGGEPIGSASGQGVFQIIGFILRCSFLMALM